MVKSLKDLGLYPDYVESFDNQESPKSDLAAVNYAIDKKYIKSDYERPGNLRCALQKLRVDAMIIDR
ncbi:MAG: hypothetical protein FWG80_04475 [Alphaproteobacteria bacterium]|nr:hypothetical protein [Alphaproteobacteria bacterium]